MTTTRRLAIRNRLFPIPAGAQVVIGLVLGGIVVFALAWLDSVNG